MHSPDDAGPTQTHTRLLAGLRAVPTLLLPGLILWGGVLGLSAIEAMADLGWTRKTVREERFEISAKPPSPTTNSPL